MISRQLKSLVLTSACFILIGSPARPATAETIVKYTDPSAFQAVTSGANTWDFESLSIGSYSNLHGPGTISMNLANVALPTTEENLFNPKLVTGHAIYINPQDTVSGDIHFANGASDFGFSTIWTNNFSVQNVTMTLYDGANNVLGTVGLTPGDSGVQGPYSAFGYGNYEGFLGFTSTTPVGRIAITQQGGADYFDNFRWNESPAVVPEPSSIACTLIGGSMILGVAWRRRKARLG